MGRDEDNNFAIEVSDLTKYYGQFLAINKVSFEVKTGQTFGFLGPNGAGKTTTVRILTGVINADSGQALIASYPAGNLKAKQITGVLPETANAYVDLSGWRNLLLMAELYGIKSKEARQRSDDLLKELGLYERRNDQVKSYSKGMKQRLVLGMALVSDPQILFLDEPTSGLDVQSSRLMKIMLQKLNRYGKTIFLTTHDMDEANQLCDQVAIINKGKIVAIDTPERLRLATKGRHSVEISFQGSVKPETLAQLSGVSEVERLGDKYRLYTNTPGDLAVTLVNYSASVGLKIVALNILAPSLEDAFVSLTEKEHSHV
ncbi:MAG: ATP-binding cassette domain-containing protein [Dehalococcoidales bacterium]|nr:ATP-binding cassette domain-containing protein [Dehalococcoidales bacterium]